MCFALTGQEERGNRWRGGFSLDSSVSIQLGRDAMQRHSEQRENLASTRLSWERVCVPSTTYSLCRAHVVGRAIPSPCPNIARPASPPCVSAAAASAVTPFGPSLAAVSHSQLRGSLHAGRRRRTTRGRGGKKKGSFATDTPTCQCIQSRGPKTKTGGAAHPVVPYVDAEQLDVLSRRSIRLLK